MQPAPLLIEYPDSDGQPMADSTLQYRWMVTLKGNFEREFAHRDDVFVAGNLLWYPVEGDPDERQSPDVMVVFGRPKGDRGSYQQWLEGFIGPQVAIEILSRSNRAGEMRQKFLFYQRHGVQEYYIYDPIRGTLEGWVRGKSRFRRILDLQGFVSPLLGCRFELAPPAPLRLFRSNGEEFWTYERVFEEHEREKQRADDNQKRADENEKKAKDQEQRALTAEERATRLAAKLRALGIDPD
jgi:Uma2 family endonuclease